MVHIDPKKPITAYFEGPPPLYHGIPTGRVLHCLPQSKSCFESQISSKKAAPIVRSSLTVVALSILNDTPNSASCSIEHYDDVFPHEIEPEGHISSSWVFNAEATLVIHYGDNEQVLKLKPLAAEQAYPSMHIALSRFAEFRCPSPSLLSLNEENKKLALLKLASKERSSEVSSFHISNSTLYTCVIASSDPNTSLVIPPKSTEVFSSRPTGLHFQIKKFLSPQISFTLETIPSHARDIRVNPTPATLVITRTTGRRWVSNLSIRAARKGESVILSVGLTKKDLSDRVKLSTQPSS